MNGGALIDRLERERDLSDAEFAALIECSDPQTLEYLAQRARAVRDAHYGRKVYIRGLISTAIIARTTASTAASGAATATPSATA